MHRLTWILVIAGIFVVLDIYVFQAVKTVSSRKIWHWLYWGMNGLTFAGIILFLLIGVENISNLVRGIFLSWIFGMLLAKILVSIFLLLDDSQRLIRWIAGFFQNVSSSNSVQKNGIPRSEFLSKAGLIISTIPLFTISYGIASGAYDYHIRRKKISLKNLPDSFNGLRIAQLSDIHSGSFYNKKAVMRGIEMVLKQKPDVIFFTGDLVNNEASEMEDYIEVFSKLKAPLGVYSTLGNHDYGDYISWPSREAKIQNLQRLISIHKEMGWNILLNENRKLTRNGEEIAILGVENWSAKSNFPKYGKLSQAYKGTEQSPVKLLLSHDPSHWRAEVLKDYPDIDITFSGHTHGFQFGIETAKIKWSPVQYVYKEWAGLYTEKDQHLYVNRGFGFIGYPGRIGILPEITIVELTKA